MHVTRLMFLAITLLLFFFSNQVHPIQLKQARVNVHYTKTIYANVKIQM